MSMKKVTLFRHAKSGEKDNPNIEDFDRPLAPRGLKAAPKMGEAMREAKLTPDLILCSPSVRTRQTLELAAPKAWDSHPDVRFEKRLYEASPATLLRALKELPGNAAHVMIVGHNPGLQELAAKLSPPGSEARHQFSEKLPTAAVVSFSFGVGTWKDLKAGTGQLQLSISPATLQS
jgi:phosphohistidine phosphatase